MQKTDSVPVKRFFIGGNTSGGFVGYMNELLCGLKKVYIIKGGPGTGKSTLMKRVAERAAGKGLDPELYYCSSDSESLDGVVIRSAGVGIVDGTAPHTVDPRYPGAREELIDLGAYWDAEALAASFPEIKRLSDRKGELFETVYKYLNVCRGVHQERGRLLRGCTDEKKAAGAVARLMKDQKPGSGFQLQPRQISSIGMRGVVTLDTYRALCREYWCIRDPRGIAPVLFDRMVRTAERLGLEVWVSRNPMMEIDALFFPQSRLAVLCGEEESNASRIINTERFIDRRALGERRAALRFLSRIERELSSRVDEVFSEIGSCHFAMEALYSASMNFAGVDAACESLVGKIFPNRGKAVEKSVGI